MPTINEGNRLGDLIVREWDELHNREAVLLLAGTSYVQGALIKLSAPAVPQTAELWTGTGTLYGVLAAATNATAANVPAAVIARGPTVLATQGLSLGAATLAQATTALNGLGISLRSKA